MRDEDVVHVVLNAILDVSAIAVNAILIVAVFRTRVLACHFQID